MTRRKCELLARGYLGMCSAEEEREDETRQDSHPSNRHAAAPRALAWLGISFYTIGRAAGAAGAVCDGNARKRRGKRRR